MRKSARIAALVAAPAILVGAVATAAPAMASAGPTSSVTISTQAQADQIMTCPGQCGYIPSNVDVPAGADVQLRWAHITGNVSVEGKLSLASSTIDRNVGVNGGSLGLFNDPGNHIHGNLSVTNSAGDSSNTALGDYSAGQLVDGNFSFLNNTGRLYVGYGMTVHNFTFAGNTGTPSDYSGLTVLGSSSISG